MGDKSAIEWTEATWNPVVGCSKVSPGCAHCYAETLTMRHAKNWGVPGLPWTPENAAENVILKPERLDQPLSWRRPRMVFVNSMSDLFHELVPDDYIVAVFRRMAAAQRHTFQVLTKRPERMRELVPFIGAVLQATTPVAFPLPNVWLGTSIENRRYVDRAAVLGEIPAAVRFVSAEPLLGPLICESASFEASAPTPEALEASRVYRWKDDYSGRDLSFYNIDGELAFHWLIAGGESGSGYRPMDPEWVRYLRDVCVHEGVAFFFKQWGGRTPKAGGRELDGRTWDEMPAREVVAA